MLRSSVRYQENIESMGAEDIIFTLNSKLFSTVQQSHPKEIETYVYHPIYMRLFIASLFSIAKN